MNTTKKILSLLLTVVMLFGIVPVTSFAEEETPKTDVRTNQVSVYGTNAIGSLISSALNGEANDSEWHISSVELKANTADVTFSYEYAGFVMLALYDENDTSKMLACAKTDFEAGSDSVTVTFEGELPEWFLLKGFLCDTTGSPVADPYESKEHTKWFYDEFTVKTVNDFDEDLVVNMDENEDNNFVVLSEDTVCITAGETNQLGELKDDGTVVIENPDETVQSLKKGDIVYYTFGEGMDDSTVLVVDSVKEKDGIVTLTAAHAEAEDVFDFVKLDTYDDNSDFDWDPENVGDGLEYVGKVNDSVNPQMRNAKPIDVNTSLNWGDTFKIKWPADDRTPSTKALKPKVKGEGSITGSLTLSFSVNLRFYHKKSYTHTEFSFEKSTEVNVTFKGGINGEIPFVAYPITFSPCFGVYIKLTPSFVFTVSASLTFKKTIKRKFGIAYDSDAGFSDISSSQPTDKPEITVDGTVYVGIKIKLIATIISEKIDSVGLEGSAGFEAKGTLSASTDTFGDAVKHECGLDGLGCIKGTISFKVELKGTVSITKLTWEHKFLTLTIKLADFYYSIKHREFGWGTCPHISYKVAVTVNNKAGKPIKDASVKCTENGEEGKTDKKGAAKIYLPNGKWSISVSADTYKTYEFTVNVASNGRKMTVSLGKKGTDETSGIDHDETFLINLINGTPAGNVSQSEAPTHILFGTYPQSRVTAPDLIAQLENEKKTWASYGYYSGTGNYADGKMEQSDFMKFADFQYNGNKYRAVEFSEYRPYDTGLKRIADFSNQDDNGYVSNSVYYFLYEPIKWRVLDAAAGLVLCENVIDAQPYQNTTYSYDIDDEYHTSWEECWHDNTKQTYANDYSASSIRNWLLNDFYETAFTKNQKNNMQLTKLDNDAFFTHYPTGSNYKKTEDPVFLLSYQDSINKKYGFGSEYEDEERQAKGTDYAKCQGVHTHPYESNYIGNSDWWIRTPREWGNDFIDIMGFGPEGPSILSSCCSGIRPACRLTSLTSDFSTSTVLFSKIKTTSIKKAPVARTATAKEKYAPNNDYMIYAIKDVSADALFSAGNVTYVDCRTTNQDGKLELPKVSSDELLLRCRNHDGEWVDAEPDEAGTPRHTFTCSVCGMTVTTEKVPEHTHSFTSYTSDHNATCTEDGTLTALCDICGIADTVMDSGSATGHEWDAGKETKAPTCKDEGETTFTCAVCGGTKTEPIAQLTEHTWDEGKETKAPTCKEEGETTFTCAVCGGTKTEPIAQLTEHTWDEGKVTKEPTTDAEGVKTFTCTVCGETKTEPVPKAIPETPAYTPGDVDGDGEVTSGDARLALRASVKLEKYEPGSAPFLAADVDGNGAVESSDARTILRVSVKLETF